MHADRAEHEVEHLRTGRRRVLQVTGETRARLLERRLVATASQGAGQQRAQPALLAGLARFLVPAELGEFRRRELAGETADQRLFRFAARQGVEAAEIGQGCRPHGQARLASELRDQFQVVAQRRAPGRDQAPGIGQQFQAGGVGQAREVLRQGVEAGAVVLDAVVTHALRVDHQGAVAAALGEGGAAAGQQGGPGPAIHGADLQRHLPQALFGGGLVQAVLFLGQRHLALAVLAGLGHRDQRIAGLQGPVRGDLADRLARRFLERRPQVARGGVRVLVRRHVGAQALAEALLAHVGLEHAQEGLALDVGDGVEGVGGLVLVLDRSLDRMGALARIEVQHLLALGDVVQVGPPFGMEVFGGLGRHPGSEALVEPEIVPPGHGHQVAEPLVRQFVGVGLEGELPRAFRTLLRVDQQQRLVVDDAAPAFHRAIEAAGNGDLVDLGQGIGNVEVVVVVAQQVAGGRQRKGGGTELAFGRDHADVDAGLTCLGTIELAYHQRHQVARHVRRGGEGDALPAAGQRRLFRDRGVRIGLEARGQVDRQLEAGAKGGLVPGRQQAPRIRRRQQRGDQLLVDAACLVGNPDQAPALAVDLAAEGHGQRIAPWRQRCVQLKNDGLLGLVDPRLQGLRRHALACERGALDGEIGGIHDNARRRAQHLDLDGLRTAEAVAGDVGRQVGVVQQRDHVLGQFAGGGGKGKRGFGLGRKGSQGQRDGGGAARWSILSHRSSLVLVGGGALGGARTQHALYETPASCIGEMRQTAENGSGLHKPGNTRALFIPLPGCC